MCPFLWIYLTFQYQPCPPLAWLAAARVMGRMNVSVPLHASEAVFGHILKQWGLAISC